MESDNIIGVMIQYVAMYSDTVGVSFIVLVLGTMTFS